MAGLLTVKSFEKPPHFHSPPNGNDFFIFNRYVRSREGVIENFFLFFRKTEEYFVHLPINQPGYDTV